MFINPRSRLLILMLLFYGAAAPAGWSRPQTQAAPGRMLLDVVVTAKSGVPARGLQQQDFTLSDNKLKQTINSFQEVDGRQAPIDVIIVIDAVNGGYSTVGFEREQIDKVLRADQGKLAYPVSLGVLTDTGLQIVEGLSSDGNALSAALDQYASGLRNFRSSGGFFEAYQVFQISLRGLQDLIDRESARSSQDLTRKVILWLSPGWPLLSGPNIQIDAKQQESLFGQIVDFSNHFRQDNITLYSIDPSGTSDPSHVFFWRNFLKGVSKPNQVQAGDLALEVLATQSGGLSLFSSNDVAAQLQKCLADLGSYYELSFDPPHGDKPNEYHQIEIRIAKPGLSARTRQGYYSQP
jgi:VWFA-related protein